MERMFAAVSDLYARYWEDFFHFAIFTDAREDRETAFRNTHMRYLKALRIENARNVLDLACGRGGFSNIIAERCPGNVLGIDASRSQLSHARRFTRSNLRFKVHDVMDVEDLGETFDAVVCLDAACYLPNKKLAIHKISKVMKPKARFLLVDWCKQEGLSTLQEEMVLHPFMNYWAIPYLETAPNYRKFFMRSGLTVLETTDLNDRVSQNWQLGYERALTAVKELSIKDALRLLWRGMRLGSDGARLLKDQFPAAPYIKVGFDAGFLRYVCFVVEKEN